MEKKIEYELVLYYLGKNSDCRDCRQYLGDDPDGVAEFSCDVIRARRLEDGLELLQDSVRTFMLEFRDCRNAQIIVGKWNAIFENNKLLYYSCVAKAREKEKYGNIIRTSILIAKVKQVIK